MSEPIGRSPWSHLDGVSSTRIVPLSKPIDDKIIVPGSKSYTNRALILAGAASGTTTMSGILRSDDTWWCIDALQRLGVGFEWQDGLLRVTGTGGYWKEAEVYLGSAGTSGRFIPGLLAASREYSTYILTASQQLSSRPMTGLADALKTLGGQLRFARKELGFPLMITGGGLKGGTVQMSGAQSSQFVSGVLIAAAMAHEPVTIEIEDHIVQKDYVQITIDIMRDFGAEVAVTDDFLKFVVTPQPYKPTLYHLEADASTATYFLALAAGSGGNIEIMNLGAFTNQPDIEILDILEKMGSRVERNKDCISLSGPRDGKLKGGFQINMQKMSDATLTVAALAPFCSGPIALTGVEHIRNHESDRIAVMCKSLQQLGIDVQELADGMIIKPGLPKSPKECEPFETYDDHRVAMSLSVLGALGRGIELLDPGCVSKTCPDFFTRLGTLGATVINRTSSKSDAQSDTSRSENNPF